MSTRLVYQSFPLELNLQENEVLVWTIEKKALYIDVCENLWKQSNGSVGDFSYIVNGQVKKFEKEICVVMNPFSIDCNERKILSKLYEELNAIALDSEVEAIAHINAELIQLLDRIIQQEPYSLEYNWSIGVQNWIKLYDVRFFYEGNSLLERIVSYIRLQHQICRISCFVFINLKLYLDSDELSQLYEMAFYEKVFLVLIEGNQSEIRTPEKHLIVDQDLCVIEL